MRYGERHKWHWTPLNVLATNFSPIYHHSQCCFALFHCRDLMLSASFLLMLTLQDDAFFVLAPRARVSAVFISSRCCRGNRQSLATKVRRVSCRYFISMMKNHEMELGVLLIDWSIEIANNICIMDFLMKYFSAKFEHKQGCIADV